MKGDNILEETLLFDFYGDLLTEHQKRIYEEVVLEDLSYGEAAAQEGISRQGVHDIIKRCGRTLREYEDALHLVERFMTMRKDLKQLCGDLRRLEKEPDASLAAESRKLAEKILEDLSS